MSRLPRWVRSLSFLLVLITLCASLPPSVLVASPRAVPTARHLVLASAPAASIALPTAAQLVLTATPTVTLILPPVEGREARTADLKSVYLPLIVKSATETEPTPTPIPGAPEPPVPPAFTYSYYIQFDDTDQACLLGRFSRIRGDQGITILAFGAPRRLNSEEETPPIYGVRLLQRDGSIGTAISFDRVREIAENFARGYMVGCGDNAESFDTNPNIIIAIGTNNSKITIDGIYDDNPYLYEDRKRTGRLWAEKVIEFKDFLDQQQYSPKLRAAGGYDAEMPDKENNWTSPENSLVWAKDYSDLMELKGKGLQYYYYGDANGAPRLDWETRNVDRLEHLYQITWGILAARPLPQMYSCAYAQEWYNVRRYAQEKNLGIALAGITTGCMTRTQEVCYTEDTRHWQELDKNPDINTLSPRQAWEAIYQIHNAPRSPNNEQVTLNPSITQALYITDIFYQPFLYPERNR